MRHTNLHNPVPRDVELPCSTFQYHSVATQYLPRPTDRLQRSFGDVLDHRRTDRTFAMLPTDQLAAVLWHAARTRASRREESGFLWQHRAAPSAGGRHPVDIFVVEPTSNQRCLSHYDPISHALHVLDVDPTHLDALLHAIEDVVPIQQATLLWFVAQVDRTLSKYDRGESLIWRDAGALLATIGLVAEALDLHSCAIGTTHDLLLARMFTMGDALISVGGCLVGTNPA